MPVTHQRLVFNLLSDEFVLTEGIACLSSDGVYGSLLHLLFDGTEQHEERLARTLLLFWKGTQGLEWKVGEKRHRKEVRGRKEICIHQHSTSRSMAHHTQQNGAFSPFWIAKMEICLTPQVTIVPPQYPYNSLKMTATTTTCTADLFQNRC